MFEQQSVCELASDPELGCQSDSESIARRGFKFKVGLASESNSDGQGSPSGTGGGGAPAGLSQAAGARCGARL